MHFLSTLLLLLQADKEDLADWEERNAAERNQGLFFQRLHKASPREKSKAGDAPGGPLDLDQEVRLAVETCAYYEAQAPPYGLLPIHMSDNIVCSLWQASTYLLFHPDQGQDPKEHQGASGRRGVQPVAPVRLRVPLPGLPGRALSRYVVPAVPSRLNLEISSEDARVLGERAP